jgi:Antibiotic biosynthesis monooxygenase
MLLVCRFTVPEDDLAEFDGRAGRVLELLTAQPGCVRGVMARSADDARSWVMTVEFESLVAYRRALAPFEVRTELVPLLSMAELAPAAFEILADARTGHVARRTSVVADDADTVRPGESGASVPPRG